MRISVLWIFVMAANVAVTILLLFEPGAIRDLMAGQWLGADAHSAAVQIPLAFNLLAPLAMAFLTLILKDAANRWTNAVVGAVATVSVVLTLFGVVGGTFGAGIVFVALVGSVVGLMIIWHAWKWPQPSEITPPQRRQEPARLGA
jgi:hypothetical protein